MKSYDAGNVNYSVLFQS